jgi:hypothetical protein
MRCPSLTTRVDHALALGHWVLAARAWTKAHPRRTGADLKIAAEHAKRAANCLDRELQAVVERTTARARAAGDKLNAGIPCSPDEVHEALAALREAINNVGRELGSPGLAEASVETCSHHETATTSSTQP